MALLSKIKSYRFKFLFPAVDYLYKNLSRHLSGRLNQIDENFAIRQMAIEHRLKHIIERRIDYLQETMGRIEARQLSLEQGLDLSQHEYRVFSQWGEDGIVQFLLRHIKVERKVFIEFGVEDYAESNTRFLLMNNNWAGLVIDGNADYISRLKSNQFYWLYNLKAVHAFITKDNINEIIRDNGITGEIGLLSVDIDGNDYWVWQAIDVISPAIVVIEYNHRFGKDLAVTIPYNEEFDRRKAHPSLLYYGASLKALCLLAERKGYTFVGCNSNGVNAFFVRQDVMPEAIKQLSVEDGYVAGQFCEAHDENGNRVKMSPHEEGEMLMSLGLPLVNVEGHHH